MSAVVPSLLIVMQQLYMTPCKVQLSIKFLFVKEEIDDHSQSIRLTKAVITNECQACVFNDGDAHEYIEMAVG